MKRIDFKTSKGEFLLVDMHGIDYTIIGINGIEVENLFYLKEATDQESISVVDSLGDGLYSNYFYKDPTTKPLKDPKVSLHSLVSSLAGVHLYENPYDDVGLVPSAAQLVYREAEQNTFYEPVIFKKLC